MRQSLSLALMYDFLPHFHKCPPVGNSLPASIIASLSLVNASQGWQYEVGVLITIPTYEPALHLFVSVFVVCITAKGGIVLINVLVHLNSSFNFLD